MDSNTLLTIGKVTGLHGLGGNLKVWSFAESVDTFCIGREVWLKSEDEEKGCAYTILKSSARKKGVLISLKDVDNIELAQALVGKEIQINKDQLPVLEEDTWYWQDLYGLMVIDKTLGKLGKIERIFPTGANDVLVVGKDEILIPMNKHFVESVDLDAGILMTNLPEGYET
jgi:16S rRNA processing protein RimM